MRILITGAAGYIGSVLVPKLMARGHEVVAVDIGAFGTKHCDFDVIKGDIGDPDPSWFWETDAIINLAGVSTDPQAAFSPALNYEYNAAGAVLLADMARSHGVKRFIQAGTCSVYGHTKGQEVNEDSLAPSDYPYGIAKLMAERGLMQLSNHEFIVTVLRKGTVCGYSPRFRNDLVVNAMVVAAITQGVIRVYDADAARPLLHIQDAAEAYYRALKAPGGIYNTLVDNYSVGQIASIVRNRLEGRWTIKAEIHDEQGTEIRDYRAANDRLGYEWGWLPRRGIADMVDHVMQNLPSDPAGPQFNNVAGWKEWLKRQS